MHFISSLSFSCLLFIAASFGVVNSTSDGHNLDNLFDMIVELQNKVESLETKVEKQNEVHDTRVDELEGRIDALENT